jgi:hypothetical protein
MDMIKHDIFVQSHSETMHKLNTHVRNCNSKIDELKQEVDELRQNAGKINAEIHAGVTEQHAGLKFSKYNSKNKVTSLISYINNSIMFQNDCKAKNKEILDNWNIIYGTREKDLNTLLDTCRKNFYELMGLVDHGLRFIKSTCNVGCTVDMGLQSHASVDGTGFTTSYDDQEVYIASSREYNRMLLMYKQSQMQYFASQASYIADNTNIVLSREYIKLQDETIVSMTEHIVVLNALLLEIDAIKIHDPSSQNIHRQALRNTIVSRRDKVVVKGTNTAPSNPTKTSSLKG